MDTTVEAIVLRRRDSGESDRRLTIFSRELGKIDVVAKGAKKPTSRLRGVSEPLNVGRFTYASGKKGEVKLLELSGFLPSFNRCVRTESKILESEAFVSPSAGGYVVNEHAGEVKDRYLVRAEALFGLAALVNCDRPPENLKYCYECLQALQPFWEYVCEAPLPARRHMLSSLRVDS